MTMVAQFNRGVHDDAALQTVDEVHEEIRDLLERTSKGLNAHPTPPVSRADAHERYVNSVMGVVSTDVINNIRNLKAQLQKLEDILIADAERIAIEISKHVQLGANVNASAKAIARRIAAMADEQVTQQ